MYYEYRPKTCQWIGNNEPCSKKVENNKSYCEFHYSQVYQTVTEDYIDKIIDVTFKLTPAPTTPILEE